MLASCTEKTTVVQTPQSCAGAFGTWRVNETQREKKGWPLCSANFNETGEGTITIGADGKWTETTTTADGTTLRFDGTFSVSEEGNACTIHVDGGRLNVPDRGWAESTRDLVFEGDAFTFAESFVFANLDGGECSAVYTSTLTR